MQAQTYVKCDKCNEEKIIVTPNQNHMDVVLDAIKLVGFICDECIDEVKIPVKKATLVNVHRVTDFEKSFLGNPGAKFFTYERMIEEQQAEPCEYPSIQQHLQWGRITAEVIQRSYPHFKKFNKSRR